MRNIQKILFVISHWKHMLWYSLEVPLWATSNEYHNICFCREIRKMSIFFGWEKCLIGSCIYYCRKRLQLHIRKKQLNVQKKCLAVWQSHFKTKVDEQRALQLWSNSCLRKAADKWRLICHKSSLERLLVSSEPVRQLNTQRGK